MSQAEFESWGPSAIPMDENGQASEHAERVLEHRLDARYGLTPEQLREAIKPVFLLMAQYGIGNVSIDKAGTNAVVTIDGKQV